MTKGDYFSVAMSFALFPVTKFWQAVSKVLRVNVYRPGNPFLFVSVVLPQLVYVAYWRRARRNGRGLLARVYRKLEYVTLGYVTTMRRVG